MNVLSTEDSNFELFEVHLESILYTFKTILLYYREKCCLLKIAICSEILTKKTESESTCGELYCILEIEVCSSIKIIAPGIHLYIAHAQTYMVELVNIVVY